jgi:hypothetical protein
MRASEKKDTFRLGNDWAHTMRGNSHGGHY